ncbi:MarR family winged helix-turn-helix transcriptional regulator [Streptomyces sp. NPDC088387]|uniref:MarR family winged helix-turn-helix transcriptional regulator n=1 Tax=Streptomyces sp. NPDC088387 TaxID=3365859 RepID=UPI003815F500
MSDGDRADLGALFARVTERLVEAEAPLLAANGLTMWEYVVLDRLSRRPAPNQLTLAREIKHDKTRLITLLDRLQKRALIDRQRDATDRRSQTVSITDQGRALHATTRAAIREMEDEFLAALDPDVRRSLLAALHRLAPENGHVPG